MKMNSIKIFFRIFISLSLIFGTLGILWLVKSLQIPTTPTGNIVLTIGSWISLVVGFVLLLPLLIQIVMLKKGRAGERKEDTEPLEECEKMLYIIRDIDNSKLSIDSKVEEMKNKIGPYIIDLSTEHKGFLYRLMKKGYRDIRYLILDIYTSLKHPHFKGERAHRYFRQLEESLSKYLNI